MGKSIKFITLVCFIACYVISTSEAQFTFHTDTNTNSFTLKAPGVQHTFTKYFGGQQGGLLQAQPTQQRQQVAPPVQSFSYQPTQQALQSAYASFQQQDQQLQTAQQQSQSQYLSAQEYAAYLQQTQAVQAAQAQHQYQQTQSAAAGQQPQTAAPQSAPLGASPEAFRQNSNLLGVAYSPSNQVSHVKFSSGGLAYNF